MSRKTKDQLEKDIADLKDYSGEYPTPSLALILSTDWKVVDESRNLKKRADTGEVYHFPEGELLDGSPEDS